MKLEIKSKNKKEIIETDGTTWVDIDDDVLLSLFIPSEIAIEVGCNYSVGENEIFDINDVRHDIECYFIDSIESILEKTIEYIKDYGDDVK